MEATRTSATGRLVRLLVALAFGVSLSNLAIGGKHVRAIHQQQRAYMDSPLENSEHFTTSEIMPVHDMIDDVYDGELITKILKGDKPFPKRNSHQRLKYRPGSLQLSQAEALRYCFVNTTHYQGHIDADRKQSLVSISDHYKIIYRNVPKSSSSSSRHAMQDFLEGQDERLKHDSIKEKVHNKGYNMVSFVREPLSRFFSSYDEAFFRAGPWMGYGPIVRDKPRMKKQYFDNKYKWKKYPYLFEGIDTIAAYRELYCPKEVLATGQFLDCNDIPSIDDGNLAHRFEQFVRDYTGLDPFDVHLNLQISSLVFQTGEPFPITTLYNATEAEKGWQEIASANGVTIPDGEMTHGRKITRRFNLDKVLDTTKRKVCRILALDYCCLNIELPPVCRESKDGKEDDAVYCAMEKRNDETMEFSLEPLVIQTWSDP